MTSVLTRIAVTVTLASMPLMTAQAADDGGLYGRALLGFNQLYDSTVNTTSGANGDLSYKPGLATGAAIGYAFEHLRLEGEVMYRTNKIDENRISGLAPGTRLTDFSSLGLGLNALYDFNLFGDGRTKAYVGAGLVYVQEIDIDLETVSGEQSFSDETSGYQLIAGARYRINEPLNLFAEIRYFDAGSVSLENESSTAERVDADYRSSSVLFGAGYSF